MMKKRIVMLLCMALIAARLLSACASGGSSTKAPDPESGTQQETQKPEAQEPEEKEPEQGAQEPETQEPEAEEPEQETQEPEPQPEEQEPVPDPMNLEYPDDFLQMVGLWFLEGGGATLEIYENGGFALYRHGDVTEGYLVYTEKPDEPWQTMPRYLLYLENNEAIPSTSLCVDEYHPDAISYLVGGGAELFIPYAPQPAHVTVCLPEELEGEYDEMLSGAGEYSVRIAFQTDETVDDFQILNLELVDVSQDGVPTFRSELRSMIPELTPDKALVVTVEFIGDTPNNGISFVDTDGRRKSYAVDVSGMDGSLYMIEY